MKFYAFSENRCSSCGTQLVPECDEDNGYQYDNALFITFHGGYGMFIDDAPFLGKGEQDYTAVLCHSCAHDLCETHPWAKFVIAPYSSHAHTEKYKADHPEHDGWDYVKDNKE